MIGGECRTHGRNTKDKELFCQKKKIGTENMEYVRVDVRIISDCIGIVLKPFEEICYFVARYYITAVLALTSVSDLCFAVKFHIKSFTLKILFEYYNRRKSFPLN
jgi:hypothetical protein